MATKLKVIIGSDGSGFELKQKTLPMLRQGDHDFEDAGCADAGGYYLDAAETVCKAIQAGTADRGILICGTGQGMNISANKFTGIRSALCYDFFTAKMSRADCDANVLCTGAWLISPEECVKMIKIWLSSDYYGTNVYGIDKMNQFEAAMRK